MHRYPGFSTPRSRNIDEKTTNNNYRKSGSNYLSSISPNFKVGNMAPRETIASEKPESAPSISISPPQAHGVVEEVAHHHRRMEAIQINALSSGAETATGTRLQEEGIQLPGQSCRCDMKISALENELIKARHKIGTMALQMEEQATHLHHLLEERFDLQAAYRPEISFPLFTPGGCNPGYNTYPQNQNNPEFYPGYNHNPRYNSRNSNQFCPSQQRGQPLTNAEKTQLVQGLNPQFVSQLTGHSPDLVESLNEKVMALQMTNLTLNLYLKNEESRRKNAESDLVKERAYIKQLEDNIQNLKSSRIVMDPKTYKQVADNYIATRKRPVRRSHTCHPCIGQTDLVCDNSATLPQELFVPSVTSCPSSPLNTKIQTAKEEQPVSKMKTHPWAQEDQMPMQRQEYEKLLNSLVDMELQSCSPP